MDILVSILYTVVGLIIGLIASMAGVGGGVLLIPTIIFFGYNVKTAIGVSKIGVMIVSIIALLNFYRARKVRLETVPIIMISMMAGSYLGAFVIKFLETNILKIILGLFLTLYSVYAVIRSIHAVKNKSDHGEGGGIKHLNYKEIVNHVRNQHPKTIFFYIIAGLGIGSLAGVTGTGGGILLVPFYHEALKFPMIEAVASSYATILAGAIISSIIHIANNQYDPLLIFTLVSGAGAGSFAGSRLALRIKPYILKVVLALIILYSGVRILFLALT